MTKHIKGSLAVCTLFLAAFVLSSGMAAACTFQCVHVSGGGPFCRQCTDTHVYTGITCDQDGECSCFFTQNTCTPFAAGLQAQSDLDAVTQPEKGGVCPASSDVSALPAALLN